jgi:hypothetical protein
MQQKTANISRTSVISFKINPPFLYYSLATGENAGGKDKAQLERKWG